jgi:hypothetical protein
VGRVIVAGEVTQVRELKRGVEAHVCLGASTEHGTAVVVHASTSPRVMAALQALKNALREDTADLLSKQLEGQRAWDREMTG